MKDKNYLRESSTPEEREKYIEILDDLYKDLHFQQEGLSSDTAKVLQERADVVAWVIEALDSEVSRDYWEDARTPWEKLGISEKDYDEGIKGDIDYDTQVEMELCSCAS